MPPQKRSRTDDSNAIVLRGGFPHPPRTVQAYREGRLCDVQLKADDGTTFDAHVLCLIAGSAYFEAMYSSRSDWSDAASSTVTLHTVPAHALQTCLEYIYAGQAEVAAEVQLPVVLECAAYLQMPELMEAVAAVLAARICSSTALDTWVVADRQGLASLKSAATTVAARNFGDVTAGEGWLRAPVECVRQLLASDRLSICDEARIYSAAVGWLRAQAPPLSAEDAAALLALVRFPLLTRDFYASTVRAEPLLKTPAGMEMLFDALGANTLGGDGTRRRMGFERLYVAGGSFGDASSRLSSLTCYDPVSDSWESMAAMRMVRAYAAAAVCDDKVYAVGGRTTESLTNTVERYNPADNAWEAVAPMSTARSSLAAAVLGGKLYAVGGSGYGGYSSVAERYNPADNTWEAVAAMRTGRKGHAAAVLDDKLYVVGGRSGSSYLKTVERYDPVDNTWEAVAPMSKARTYLAATVIDGKLFAIGGDDGTDTLNLVERYDPVSSTWSTLAAMPTIRYGFGAAAIGGKLYAVGGRIDGGRTSAVERYDPATNTWETMAPMGQAPEGLVCVSR